MIQSGYDDIRASGNVTQVGGEYVGGDRITTGDISGAGIAIGRGAQAHVQQGGGDHKTFARAFAPIYAAINAHAQDPNVDKERIVRY